MIAGLDGWTEEEVRRAALDGPRHAFGPAPSLEVIERPGWLQLVAPQFKDGGLNGVWHSVLADDEADAVIDAVIARYHALGVRFRWLTDPDSRPLDLALRLARRGLRGEPCKIMARATAGATAGFGPADGAEVDRDVTVERVDATNLPDFDHVMCAGWEMDTPPFAAYHRAMLADPAGAAALYLARWRGEPAGTSTHLRRGRATCLVGGVVLPAARGRGVYRAMVARRLADAAAAGVSLAVTLARATTSAPILERLGFATVCDTMSFRSA
ncbi:MAG TPA: GNAT family N-acetyltransferase [Kofleriaceae bacterium]|nr:GNAT family N-acetyltransferase [Kofleriaceae bacterium]